MNELSKDAMATYLLNRPGELVTRSENHTNDIFDMTAHPATLASFGQRMRDEHGDVTLVAGGPPCQGYSGIGHRRSFQLAKEDIPSNHLYREMARVVQAVAPRAFLFENVRGLLTARWTPSGTRGEIWEDVQAAFRAIRVEVDGRYVDYEVRPELIFAKDYGVPQNRPRVLMVGLRRDVFEAAEVDTSLPARGFLPAGKAVAPSLKDLLGDLVDPAWVPGGSSAHYPSEPRTSAQVLLRTRRDGTLMLNGSELTEHEYAKHSPRIIAKFEHMLAHGGAIPASMRTKKFAQRVLPESWGETGPSITATSLPDDYVHFSQPRIPTVREWARLQTFPDWYQFSGRKSTGGRRRAGDPSIGEWSRDVPKYTQIGNAVPARLATAVGEHLLKLVSPKG